MSIEDYRRASRLINQHVEFADFIGPQSETLIVDAEKVIGFKFPPTYRTFLKDFGAGCFGSEEFYGLIGKHEFENSGVPNGIWLYLDDRKNDRRNGFFGFYDLGEGTTFGFDLSRVKEDGEFKIVSTHAGGVLKDEEYEDFGSFFLATIKEFLESR